MHTDVTERVAQFGVHDIHEAAGHVRRLDKRFRSGIPGLAEAHDEYLDDAFGW